METTQIIGKVIYRDEEIPLGLKKEDRNKHVYIIGKTGQGKTTLLENMMIQDIKNGEGFAYFDPHGDSVRRLLDFIPQERIDEVIYFNPADIDYPFAFNPLENVSFEQRHLTALSLLSVFKKIWADAWSARMEYILTNALLALLEYPYATLLDVNRMLSDEEFREKVVNNLKDEVVKNFWTQEFNKYHLQFRTEAVAPIQNKIGQFITNPLIRNIIGQTRSSFDLREIMDRKKIFLVNLSTGLIGEETAKLLGGFLIAKLQIAAMSRANIPEEKRVDFYVYIDEFQNFATESFLNILPEARKYHLSLIFSHQFLGQVDERIIKTILGNVGTIISFRVGAEDAERLEKEFDYLVESEKLTSLPQFHAYVKTTSKGMPIKPLMMITLPPFPKPEISYQEEIIKRNREKYAQERKTVEKKIEKIYTKIKWGGKVFIHCRLCGVPFYSQKNIELCDDCEEKWEKQSYKQIVSSIGQEEKYSGENEISKILAKLEKTEGENNRN